MTQTLQIVCPACSAVNRVPQDKPVLQGKCGKCHQQLIQGMPLKLTEGNFDLFIGSSSLPLLVDFWAPWCGPCKMMEQVFVQAARQLQTRAVLAKLNTDEEQRIAARYGIMSIPTLVVFAAGTERARSSGAMDLQRLLAWAGRYV